MPKENRIGFFEKYLSIWVLACIIFGVFLGNLFRQKIEIISDWNIYSINIPVAFLVWLMIYPMMVQIDFSSLKEVGKNWKGIGLTVLVNWLIKPFTLAMISYLFFFIIFARYLNVAEANQYLAGTILLGAAPCTAMVFVWSYLTNGNPNYTLVQVSLNDLILLFAFIPIVAFLFQLFDIGFISDAGVELGIPYMSLLTSVIIFVLIPLLTAYFTHFVVRANQLEDWFTNSFLKYLKPISMAALLLTLILIFAFQGRTILNNPIHILFIAIPLSIQTYLIFFITWYGGKLMKLPHNICAPSAMIGASNFFELAVAVAISLFGLQSGAALATVVGVLIEVPIMLSLVAFINYKAPKK